MEVDIFDFDGTLIKGDSIKLFSKWVCDSKLEFIYHYYLFYFSFKGFKKLKFDRVFFFHSLMIKKNKNISDFHEVLDSCLFKDSLGLLKEDNTPNIIISASFYEIIGSYCKDVLGVKLIANSLSSIIDVNFTHKLSALKNDFDDSVLIRKAYGNSEGDFEILRNSKSGFFRTENGELINWVDPEK